MNKSAIQKFAIWARKELIAQVSQRAYQYGITQEGYGEADAVTVRGHALSSEEAKQRKELVGQIRQKGYTQVMEEVAYTWFNRFIALRFMEVNNYLPSHIRVFSDSTGAFKPEILGDALHLDLPGLDRDRVAAYIESNQTENLYRYLLLTQCDALNAALPQMFEKMGGYTELLFPNNMLKHDSVLERMVTDIPEEDWTDQVQIIGWLYQYYNSELKDDTFALLKKNVKITKERIPSATQLFTPDWIVRYMVENSLGRLWIEGHPDEELKSGWKYYLDEAEQEPEVQKQLDVIHAEYASFKPQDIKLIDPCMGSGHILVYAFDVLIQIYKKCGVSEREAAQSILQNNLYGLDVDDRAAQLAYFAVMMKARQYDRRIFSRGVQPHLYAIRESNEFRDIIGEHTPKMGDFLLSEKHRKTLNYLLDVFIDAKDYGSALCLERKDYEGLLTAWKNTASQTAGTYGMSLWYNTLKDAVPKLIEQAILLTQEYDAVVTNPPYMGSGKMNEKLSVFVKENYPDSKSDLFAVFIERCGLLTGRKRYLAMITQHSWMFLSSFEGLRNKLLLQTDILNMAHLGPRAFEEIGGEVVQPTSFVLRNSHVANYKGVYCRLLEPTTQQNKETMFLAGENRYIAQQSNFSQIPGSPVAYWVSNNLLEAFNNKRLSDFAQTKQGFATGDNNKFLRLWHEVSEKNSALSLIKGGKEKWFPCNKGGSYRKWYGNNIYLANWYNNGVEMRAFSGAVIRNPQFYFKKGLTWSSLANQLSFRFSPEGYVFESKGSMCFVNNDKDLWGILGLLNSKITEFALTVLSPTLDFHEGPMLKVPVVLPLSIEQIDKLVGQNIELNRKDWDSYETSWNFKRQPIAPSAKVREEQQQSQFAASCIEKLGLVSWHFEEWKRECEERFLQLKRNEEELNRIFIDIYGLQDELAPEVANKDITVHRIYDTKDEVPESMKGSNYVRTKRDEIVSLISYAVGCMFGRYSLDEEGLAYAGGEWDASKYSTITPDKDNIIPICDDDYFDDDMAGRFVKWVATVYGSETLEENLTFIADALGGNGAPREVIRGYFLNDFFADHCKTYQKRPIYWLFDSGKKNGFKALIYMHRYQSDLLARMRTDYVHEQQERYRTQLTHLADALGRASGSERVKLTKQQRKLQDQSLEIQKFEEKIHHLADQNIAIDLDDGVKHNYALFADVLAKIK
ncbi:BREX-1 system adenine-specific DNA-methyltransferase PglX [uncultured Cloacibacillus sp.]|mgnify:CR=1 FL=1|uniref:BREX-1 system adenine-specific DNA-methyltransferase PglX n=1 Tax=uncultured Cloacibacillus sp. TaxID=889794 RepID=UPI00262CB4AA|nr:BREX-1 system adenine-specific DNA-methyltransferase PglX [uncultured Cloacibacillus sp.]